MIIVKEIRMEPDEIIEYVRENVKKDDIFELAYNRIFAPGVVLGLTEEDEETGEGLRIGLQLTGKVLSDTVEIDLHKLKDEIVEIRHIPTGDPDDEENLVVIEAYDDDDIVKVEYDM
ncbi:MAG: DUF2097 domain-containing protein [Methanobrevibacter sp.]|jgi:hypothetical protein|nr:DUF2097 domain-containing protein [Methanobrevibacter sp.]